MVIVRQYGASSGISPWGENYTVNINLDERESRSILINPTLLVTNGLSFFLRKL